MLIYAADAISEVRKKKVLKKKQNIETTADVQGAGKQDKIMNKKKKKKVILHNANKTPTWHVVLLLASIVWTSE